MIPEIQRERAREIRSIRSWEIVRGIEGRSQVVGRAVRWRAVSRSDSDRW